MKRTDTFAPFAAARLQKIADLARDGRIRCTRCGRPFVTASEYKLENGKLVCRYQCKKVPS